MNEVNSVFFIFTQNSKLIESFIKLVFECARPAKVEPWEKSHVLNQRINAYDII